MEMVREFIFGDSKITADGDCRHEFKRHLFLRRKAMTNIDSILKSRDITLSTKVLLVKVVFFLLVRHRCEFSSVQFSCSVMSDSLWPREPQHVRPPCPSPMPRVYPNSCPLSWWCHPTISSSVVPFSSAFNLSQHQDLFQRVSSSHQVAKYWSFSFSISPSNEYSRLIFFRMDWLDLLAVQGTLKNPPTPQFKSINSSVLSFLYSPTLTSIHDHWKNHSLDSMDLCWQSNVSAF